MKHQPLSLNKADLRKEIAPNSGGQLGDEDTFGVRADCNFCGEDGGRVATAPQAEGKTLSCANCNCVLAIFNCMAMHGHAYPEPPNESGFPQKRTKPLWAAKLSCSISFLV